MITPDYKQGTKHAKETLVLIGSLLLLSSFILGLTAGMEYLASREKPAGPICYPGAEPTKNDNCK